MEFDREYQEHLVAKMLTKSFMKSAYPVIDSSVFDPDLRVGVDFILSCWKKGERVPSKPQLKPHLQNVHLPSGRGNDLIDLDNLKEFNRHRKIREHLLNATALLAENDYEGVVNETLLVSRQTGNNSFEGNVIDFFKDDVSGSARQNPLLLNLDSFDTGMGGICVGETLLLIGETNSGKSSFLVYAGAAAVHRGFNVLHLSLEMEAGVMRDKYAPSFKQRTSNGRSKKARRKLGHLHILTAGSYTVNPKTLLKEIKKFDTRPDVLIVDSGDLLKAPREFGQRYEEETETYAELKAMAHALQCRVLIADQANRGGYDSEYIKCNHVKGSLAKTQPMDFVISINQDSTEALPDANGSVRQRLFLAKNRYGPKFITCPVDVQFASCTMEEVK